MTDILTQNADLTQMGDEEEEEGEFFGSPSLTPSSCNVNSSKNDISPVRIHPWGRLLPCIESGGPIVQLLLRPPPNNPPSATVAAEDTGTSPITTTATTTATTAGSCLDPGESARHNSNNKNTNNNGTTWQHPSSLQFLKNVTKSDIFNEYWLGRSTKCDVRATKPSKKGSSSSSMDAKIYARQEWANGLISNQHCKIYCVLGDRASEQDATGSGNHNNPSMMFDYYNSKLESMQVYVEDCSGNGTLVNHTIVLQRGEKRLLHSGDEICLVNPIVLRKKFRSASEIESVLQQHSYVFVMNTNNNAVVAGAAAGNRRCGPILQPFHLHGQSQQQLDEQPPPLSLMSRITQRVGAAHPHETLSPKRKAAVDVRAVKTHSRPSPPLSAPSDVSQQYAKRLRSSLSLSLSMSLTSNPGTVGNDTTSLHRRISPRRQKPRRIQEDYDIRDTLGSGTVGEVRRAIHRQTGVTRAVKIISVARNHRLHSNAPDSNAELQAEAEILRQLQHPYIVQLVDFYVSPAAVYLVMELMPGGDLFDRIIAKGKYTDTEARRVMRRLLAAIHYLHEDRKLVHRDLKPENILCSSNDNDIEIKLTDFGLAKAEGELKTFCGTPQYFAP
jgi:Protein kinase domain/FHA domain